MGFTVTYQGGTKDVEFEAYARLLRQKGVDLAKLSRVPEPGTSRPGFTSGLSKPMPKRSRTNSRNARETMPGRWSR